MTEACCVCLDTVLTEGNYYCPDFINTTKKTFKDIIHKVPIGMLIFLQNFEPNERVELMMNTFSFEKGVNRNCPCHHKICWGCYEKIVVDSPEDKYKCPLCRFQRPANFIPQKLVEEEIKMAGELIMDQVLVGVDEMKKVADSIASIIVGTEFARETRVSMHELMEMGVFVIHKKRFVLCDDEKLKEFATTFANRWKDAIYSVDMVEDFKAMVYNVLIGNFNTFIKNAVAFSEKNWDGHLSLKKRFVAYSCKF